MALIPCPTCSSTLRVPDGITAQVRCPGCKTVFEAAAPPVARPAVTAKVVRPADDPPRSSSKIRRRDDDYDDPPRPSGKSRRRDDDYDDEPPRSSSRVRRRDDDDDDYDDRPRRRRRDDDDDYDDDYGDRRDDPVRGEFARGRLGALLLAISFWLYLSTLSVQALFIVLVWGGVQMSTNLPVLPGVLGLANWLIAGVGLGFCCAGPTKYSARGLAIAAAAVAGVHFLFTVIIASEGRGGFDLFGGDGPAFATKKFAWEALGSQLSSFEGAISWIIYGQGGRRGGHVLAVIAGTVEVARFVLVVLALKAMSRAAKGYDGVEKSQMALTAVLVTVGLCMLLYTIVGVVIHEAKFTRTLWNIVFGLLALGATCQALAMILPGMAGHAAAAGLGRKAR